MGLIETAALWLIAVAAFGFFCWQSYKLHAILADEDHPYHDDYAEMMAEQYRDPFRNRPF